MHRCDRPDSGQRPPLARLRQVRATSVLNVRMWPCGFEEHPGLGGHQGSEIDAISK